MSNFYHVCIPVDYLVEDWQDIFKEAGVVAFALHETAYGKHVHAVIPEMDLDMLSDSLYFLRVSDLDEMLDYMRKDKTCIEFYSVRKM